MKYMVRTSYVDVLGGIWLPYGAVCSLRKPLDRFDVDNMRDDDGKITRESVKFWVMLHSSDFSGVIDFSASIEDGEQTIDLPWSSEETELQYLNTIDGAEDHDDA